ncbi:MAG: RES family NAD+ phosphorylase [Hyphomicrobiales bacterium]
MIDIDQIPINLFTQSNTIRLISTAYIDEPALQPLSDSDDELAFLEALEGLTSARMAKGIPLPSGVNPHELLNQHHGYGWSYVNSAFCYTRVTGNRFNGPDRGAWYATWGENSVATAKSEVGWHLTRELEATGVFENTTSYRELLAGFNTGFHDLRGYSNEPFFDDEPMIGYPIGQALAKALRTTGCQGIIYQSVRHSDGLCLAAFRPNTVQNIRQGDCWKFVWSGSATPTIKKQ